VVLTCGHVVFTWHFFRMLRPSAEIERRQPPWHAVRPVIVQLEAT
jgi:hypothetical protein